MRRTERRSPRDRAADREQLLVEVHARHVVAELGERPGMPARAAGDVEQLAARRARRARGRTAPPPHTACRRRSRRRRAAWRPVYEFTRRRPVDDRSTTCAISVVAQRRSTTAGSSRAPRAPRRPGTGRRGSLAAARRNGCRFIGQKNVRDSMPSSREPRRRARRGDRPNPSSTTTAYIQ